VPSRGNTTTGRPPWSCWATEGTAMFCPRASNRICGPRVIFCASALLAAAGGVASSVRLGPGRAHGGDEG
jgi:hypothetical protein